MGPTCSLSYSNGDWNFPSPHATPGTSHAFSQALQTPKTATFPSHFHDAFNTPQMPAYTTPQQPQHSSMTPVQRPQQPPQYVQQNFQPTMNGPIMQNMAPPTQAGFAPSPITNDHQFDMHMSPNPAMMSMNQPVIAQQMQTPPPTRGSTARKPQQTTQVAFGTPSTIASRRFMTPQQQVPFQPAAAGPQTPVQFPQLQFSPDVYQFANFGPASAPVMPQTQLLWEHVHTPVAMPQQKPLEDPFAPAVQPSPVWPIPSPFTNQPQTMSFETPAMTSFSVQPPHPRPASAAPLQTGFIPIGDPAVSSASLDPSLIYSSPFRPVVRSSSRASKGKQEKTKVARKDSASDARSQADSASPADSALPAPAPQLRRSNTTGNVRSGTAQSAISMASEPLDRSTSMAIPRTASPLKRVGRTPLGSISEHKPRKRASVILTIDENGMARTETRPAEESPTKSIRDRYPGLFDSDSSEDESDVSESESSRKASFSFARKDERRWKAARLDPPVENLEGLSIPRTGSSASMRGVTPSRAAIAAAAQLRRNGSVRRPSRSASGRRINPMSASTSSLIDSCPMDMLSEQDVGGAEDPHDHTAWPAGSSQRDHGTLDAHNRRWSMMSFEQQQPAPSLSSRSGPPRLIRCVCGITHDRGTQLIRCTSCTQWLHKPCVGLDLRPAPPAFTCFLCTKPAGPGMRR